MVIGLWSSFEVAMTHYLLRHDPTLLVERLKLVPLAKEQKTWDKVVMLPFFVAGIGLYIIPGFDVVRYQWSEPLPRGGFAQAVSHPALGAGLSVPWSYCSCLSSISLTSSSWLPRRTVRISTLSLTL